MTTHGYIHRDEFHNQTVSYHTWLHRDEFHNQTVSYVAYKGVPVEWLSLVVHALHFILENFVTHTWYYRKFDCSDSEILSRDSYFLGNFIAEINFVPGNIIAEI